MNKLIKIIFFYVAWQYETVDMFERINYNELFKNACINLWIDIFILSSSNTKPSVRLLLLKKFGRLHVDRNIHLEK